ncbi:MAG: hypothetical protein EAZ71_06875 [Verrucomicrobia bacterium]|nr:MAG: hypothetical protein EAZ82_12490 [Verrucomicrobiota bacterium]TAF25860.1 MAG: hypothetical protein EAZ71_06875 [Verrucomicrobiota bacterium]
MIDSELSSASAAPGVCLVVIYNHNYERNIEKIERLYKGKFSDVYHLMPFYQGDSPRVIGVYDSSHQFNNYITQAYDRLASKCYSHFIFVADDMIIRQDLNECNILEKLNVGPNSAFVPFLRVIDNKSFFTWPWALKQVGKLNFPTPACEFRKFMPDLETARRLLERHGIDWRQGYTRSVLVHALRGCISPFPMQLMRSYLSSSILALRFKLTRAFRGFFGRKVGWEDFIEENAKRIAKRGEEPEYPLLWAYVDMFVLPASRFKEFCHMSGVLAGGRVMVEVAIPTAMAFTVDHIVQSDAGDMLDGRFEGSPQEIFERNHGSVSSLIKNWKEGVLFYHPIKLSQWKLDLD